MAAFDKVKSGIPGVDRVLDHIRMGDNVVWQVSRLEEYQYFVKPFVEQAKRDGRNLIYIRFALHPPMVEETEGVKVCRFDPDQGFEAFTVAIHEVITREGRGAFYVFDSLSELQSAWYTDLMMGNFFRVTCPYLFELDTVAYFPLLRGKHSFDAVARIRETTQLLLDVYADGKKRYLHPLKVWNRYSATMFLPHVAGEDGGFEPIQDGLGMSRYYRLLEEVNKGTPDQSFDSYDRFFTAAKFEYEAGRFQECTADLIVESTMTRDKKLGRLLKQYFVPEDYFTLRSRMIGSGAIGGKACGMLLARKIVEKRLPEERLHTEPHDSFYIGSDVFYTYIVSNNCWKTRIRQRTKEGYFQKAGELRECLLRGVFPSNLREQFQHMLEYFGQNPIIVRSSSFLEDGFGNAFAGKYESVFCSNQGNLEERLLEFEQAVRTVYASTMDLSALEYRKSRGLEQKDEQMAVLVQRVSGSRYGDYFMPCAAGVGYSHSAYQWHRDMDPSAGMLRIVMGLGTRAVDRTENDYPRLVNLDRPAASSVTTDAEKHRFSQHNIDVVDLSERRLRPVELSSLLPLLPAWYRDTVLEHDREAEEHLRRMGKRDMVYFISCQNLLENRRFTGMMQNILRQLQEVYGSPVDIEYTVNLSPEGDFVVNLLQCRPLYVGPAGKAESVPSLPAEDVLFHLQNSSMGQSKVRNIDVVVSIDPKGYYAYPYPKKSQVAAAVGEINRHYKGAGRSILLLAPGRIGTSSPELGVPVTFADISGVSAICEVSDKSAGYMPELSYGSHMFQDLVEAEIYYGAVFGDERTVQYRPGLLEDLPNRFSEICPGTGSEMERLIRVWEPQNLRLWMDAVKNEALCGIVRMA